MNPIEKVPGAGAAQRVGVGQQGHGVGEQLPARRGQLGRSLVPGEQLDLQLVL
jgi:hypothetical protein